MNDLSGQKIGKLLVLNNYYKKINTYYWECLCQCGRKRFIKEWDLLSGDYAKCGYCRKENGYRILDDCIIGILDNGNEFVISKEDFEKIRIYKWRENDEGYIYTISGDGKKRYIHRIIMDLNSYDIDRITVDHINRDKKDNRKFNLRLADKTENKRNGNIRKTNTSGIIGVGWYKRYKKYVAFIAVNKVDKNLGYYENFEDAIKVRLQAEKEFFGEFAPQQHLFIQYGII